MSKEKFIHITAMGTTYAVPAHIVADNMAKYYSEDDPTTSYDEEYKFAMEDDLILEDWCFKNMNPEDFGESPVRVHRAPVSFSDVFHCDDNPSIEVVEVDILS